MSKTFREVIRDIKPNETYRCKVDGEGTMEIYCNKDDSITISTLHRCMLIKSSYEFKKLRNKVSFDVAFKEYNKGKEIESCYSGYKYRLENNKHYTKSSSNSIWKRTGGMKVGEIISDWYVND